MSFWRPLSSDEEEAVNIIRKIAEMSANKKKIEIIQKKNAEMTTWLIELEARNLRHKKYLRDKEENAKRESLSLCYLLPLLRYYGKILYRKDAIVEYGANGSYHAYVINRGTLLWEFSAEPVGDLEAVVEIATVHSQTRFTISMSESTKCRTSENIHMIRETYEAARTGAVLPHTSFDVVVPLAATRVENFSYYLFEIIEYNQILAEVHCRQKSYIKQKQHEIDAQKIINNLPF